MIYGRPTSDPRATHDIPCATHRAPQGRPRPTYTSRMTDERCTHTPQATRHTTLGHPTNIPLSPDFHATENHGSSADCPWVVRRLSIGGPPRGANVLPVRHPCAVGEAPMGRSRGVHGMPTGRRWAVHGSPVKCTHSRKCTIADSAQYIIVVGQVQDGLL